MPAHWSLSVLNVRDTFKDAFRSPLIIHTAWIINNNSHWSFSFTTPPFLLVPHPSLSLSFSTTCSRPFFHYTHYSLLTVNPLCNISFFLFSPLFPFFMHHIILFPWQGLSVHNGLFLCCHWATSCVVVLWIPPYINILNKLTGKPCSTVVR